MTLSDFLAVPYLLEAEAFESEPDQWTIRLSYPELPDCVAEAPIVEDAVRELERCRIETIVRLVAEGKEPPVPRKPLSMTDPLWAARDLGLSERTIQLLSDENR